MKAQLVLILVLVLSSLSKAQVPVDAKLVPYKKTAGVTGQIKSVGSDTMDQLMKLWSEKFREYYPGVRFEVEGQGSSKAMPALIEGAATFGPMSRDAKASEINDFEKKRGYKPLQLPTSIDMLAVYVHRDNPIQYISIEEVDAIFSSTRKMGANAPIDTWGQLKLENDFASAPIAIFGRNAASGTYGFFKEKVLGDGDYRNTMNEQPGSTAVVQSVGVNRFGMGFSGIGYKTAAVKALNLANKRGEEPIAPTIENAYNGKYPLWRYLLLTVDYKPNSQLEPLRREFIKFVYSREGQELVAKEGYYPINAAVAQQALKLCNIK